MSEKRISVKKIAPWTLFDQNQVHDLVPPFKLLFHNGLRRPGNVVRSTHRGVSRGDNGHPMRLVCGVKLRVPNTDLEITIFNLFEHDGLRPVPMKLAVSINTSNATWIGKKTNHFAIRRKKRATIDAAHALG